jgi:hypothetical protein
MSGGAARSHRRARLLGAASAATMADKELELADPTGRRYYAVEMRGVR